MARYTRKAATRRTTRSTSSRASYARPARRAPARRVAARRPASRGTSSTVRIVIEQAAPSAGSDPSIISARQVEPKKSRF